MDVDGNSQVDFSAADLYPDSIAMKSVLGAAGYLDECDEEAQCISP